MVLSMLISTACGAAFHAWRGEGYGKLAWYLLAAGLGFALGQLAGWLIGWDIAMIGHVYMLEGLAGSLTMLVLSSWIKL